jgi:hypothetical protein
LNFPINQNTGLLELGTQNIGKAEMWGVSTRTPMKHWWLTTYYKGRATFYSFNIPLLSLLQLLLKPTYTYRSSH